MLRKKLEERITKVSARISIVVFFLMAFEIMIMISPFAFFFYSVFNPVFHWLDRFASTRWLISFFLPHMFSLRQNSFASCACLGPFVSWLVP